MLGIMRVDRAKRGVGSFISKFLKRVRIRMARLKVVKNWATARRRRPLAKRAVTLLLYMENSVSWKLSAMAGRH